MQGDFSPFYAFAFPVGRDSLLVAQLANAGPGPAVTPPLSRP